jgi:predicted MPP superfamily phosphohydrolase
MRITWLTDIHLDFITSPDDIRSSIKNLDIFCSLILRENPDACLITGDLSRHPFLKDHLLALENRLQIPIYFVLGNHDFWGSDIATTRKLMIELTESSDNITYLPVTNYFVLNNSTVLIGHDGWYDALYAEPQFSNFIMNDWMRIGDFVNAGSIVNKRVNLDSIIRIARNQASLAANHVSTAINEAIVRKNPKKIIIATHVPPFVQPLQNSRGSLSDKSPWYASKIMGNMLLSIAKVNQSVQFEVFCGHCHNEYDGKITSNILLHSGGAEYSQPQPQKTIEIFP